MIRRKDINLSVFAYSMDNDDQNFEYKHYKLNNVKHVVNDRLDMYNNKMMNRENFEQELYMVVELMENNFHF